MSDHNPNGDDDWDNPMHRIGYGRGDDNADGLKHGRRNDDSNMGHESVPYKPRVTQAYSMIDPNRIINVGESKVEPTVPMHAVEILSVKDIVHRLVERNLQAWKALPEKIRDAMMERPQNFQLIPTKNPKADDFDYSIGYSGTVWRYHPTALVWMIADIIQ